MPKSRIFNMENMSFDAFRENEILAKISEFTVSAAEMPRASALIPRCVRVIRSGFCLPLLFAFI